jgi:nucleoside permease NupC
MWHGILGIIAFPLIAWALSENRRGVDVKAAIIGIALQLVLAGLLLGILPIKHAFLALNNVVLIIVEATRAGTSFVFGYLGGGQLPFEATGAGTTFNLTFQALPLILVMSALAALLFHWRVLPVIVKAAAWVLQRTLRLGGALGVGVAAAITIAALMVRLDEPTPGDIELPKDGNAMAAITRGTMEGVTLLINVIAMLVVVVALVALLNMLLGLLPDIDGGALSLERILGWIMAPIVFLMGIPWSEASDAGALMGVKTVLNEFLAYLQMAALPSDVLSDRSRSIMTYALCGFANFGSLGIMIGGLTTLCPERRDAIIALGGRTNISGTLATCMTGAVAGLFF